MAKEEHHDFSESLAADVFTTLLNFLSNDILTEKRAALKRKLLDTCLIGLSNASKTTANVEKLLNIANIESGESVMVSCIDNFLAYNPQLEMEDDEEDDDEWRYGTPSKCFFLERYIGMGDGILDIWATSFAISVKWSEGGGSFFR